MAAATVVAGYPRINVNGAFREYYYRLAWAADADYLDVPLKSVVNVKLTDDTIQACGIASVTLQTNGQSRIVFNSAGAITGAWLSVTGT